MTKASSTPAATPSTPQDFVDLTWKIRASLSKQIPEFRSTAYAVAGYFASQMRKGGRSAARPPGSHPATMPRRGTQTVDEWMTQVEDWARELGQHLHDQSADLDGKPASVVPFVIDTTQSAGYLLGATEAVILETQPSPPAGGGGTPPPPDPVVALTAYTCVMTARDHLVAAQGWLQKARRSISLRETGWLLGALIGAVFLYTAFHPIWGWWAPMGVWYHFPGGATRLSPTVAPWWEVVFWSFFGAVASSYLRVSKDTEDNTFDARDPFKYVYRIFTAPVVAVVLVLLWSITGFSLSSSGGSVQLPAGSTPSTLVLVVVSFLLGFFSREALDVLYNVWKKVAPPPAPSGESTETEGTSGSSTPS